MHKAFASKLVFFVFMVLFHNMSTAADTLRSIPYHHPVTICDANPLLNTPLNNINCHEAKLIDIDPQNTDIWVKINFEDTAFWHDIKPPYGLYLSAKAASTVYVNGELLGHNGTPSTNKNEQPGLMDSVFHLPQSAIKPLNNELIFNFSGYHSLIHLGTPVHLIAFAQFGDPKRFIQYYNYVALILIGAFMVGALYFLILSFGNNKIRTYRLFSTLCFVASCQLGAEVSRRFIDYTYPWHDVRLVTITLLACLFGLLVLIYVASKVKPGKAIHWIYGGLLLTLVLVIVVPGFDTKTTAGIFTPLLVGIALLTTSWLKTKDKHILTWLIVKLLLVALIFISATSFHEIIYFVVIGLFLCYLFVQQAYELRLQNEQLQQEQSKLAKLEYQLAQTAQTKAPSKLEISSAGKVQYVNSTDIAFCKAAGDYVEIHMLDKTDTLYSGTLKQLESFLPATFLRVHRSYIVNLSMVDTLSSNSNRSDSTAHVLQLNNQQTVPVSRRLLPTVRDTLKQVIH